MITVNARPESIQIDPSHAAVLVIDMQNAFATTGGMLDLAGVDISEAQNAVTNAARVVTSARAAGVAIVYLEVGYPTDKSTAGGPLSPNPFKELSLRLAHDRPELAGQLLTWGTWDFEIVEPLAPAPHDIVIRKSRYSGFVGTELDSVLRTRGIRYLIFTGIASNVCVESTLRDAYFHEYWPLLVEDATMPAGGKDVHAATVYNVEHFFGWVCTTEGLSNALDFVNRGVPSRSDANSRVNR
jgi:ureidoacrylate peracid hydrolase